MPYIQCLGLGFSKKHVVQDLYVLDVFFFCRQKITQAERWCRYTESPLKGFSVALVGRSQQLNDCVHNTKEIKRSVFSLLKSYQTQFWDITCFEGESFDGTYMPDQWYVMFVGCLVLLLLLSSPDLVVQNCRAFFCFKVFQLNQKTLKSSHPQNFRPLKNSPPLHHTGSFTLPLEGPMIPPNFLPSNKMMRYPNHRSIPFRWAEAQRDRPVLARHQREE